MLLFVSMLTQEAYESCTGCGKPVPLCVCGVLQPVKAKTHILILQHPQEPDKHIGSAELLHRALPNSTLRVGLSWRNLSAALGKEVESKSWMVLYLGSAEVPRPSKVPALVRVGRNGRPLTQEEEEGFPKPRGIVLLDGTWSQAKTLWWRNAWLLKLQRAVLVPADRSLYGALRKEPRPDSISTLESGALALSLQEGREDIYTTLLAPFAELLKNIAAHPEFHPRPKKRKPDRRRTGRHRGQGSRGARRG